LVVLLMMFDVVYALEWGWRFGKEHAVDACWIMGFDIRFTLAGLLPNICLNRDVK
jgi:hypothetical protein